ncbi:MAG: hypothetical protein ABEL04_15745 [Salinibacter sp.]|uniref:hypothetical protein n=1 Tax=Salinibacter sp. TaxID=2065818 RepID=UPI0035D4B6BC
MLCPRRSLFTSIAVLLGSLIVLAGCGGGGGAENGGVQIQAGDRSPAIEGASARVTALTDSAVVDSASVDVTVTADSFETGIQTETPRADSIANSGNGQHFHVILDNQPYMANYTEGEPFDLGTLEPGAHTLVVFPSRSYHESVKGRDAYDLVNFYVKSDSGSFMLGPKEPALIYSRPKGTYSGADAEKIMLDFYLHNVQLSQDGYKARYTITDDQGNEVASTTLTEWAPAFVTGLEAGTYEVNLKLIGSDGNVVPGPFNNTTREITVETGGGQGM